MISRENYEIWMIDYLDGTLSESDQKLLLRFLEENPDLKNELEGMDKPILKAPENSYDKKFELLKTEADIYEMDYPEFLAVKENEEGLEEDEILLKQSYLKEDQSRLDLFNIYPKLKLVSNQSIKYKGKHHLKRAILIPWVSQYTLRKVSAAAVIAILLSVGSLPLLKDNANSLQTVVVNDPPSLIKLPKVTQVDSIQSSKDYKAMEIKENQLGDINRNGKEIHKENQAIKREYIPLNTMQPQGIASSLTNDRVNAYEVGLNAMMPILIASNLEQREINKIEEQHRIQQESARLSRSSKALSSGIKVLNFLSGDETQVKKYINQNGDMVAYQLESDNISISRKIKSSPVTN